jgi:hypothetical protein
MMPSGVCRPLTLGGLLPSKHSDSNHRLRNRTRKYSLHPGIYSKLCSFVLIFVQLTAVHRIIP